VSNKKL